MSDVVIKVENLSKLYRLGEVKTRLRCTSALLCRSGYRASPERLRDGAARLRDETLQRAGAKAMTGRLVRFLTT